MGTSVFALAFLWLALQGLLMVRYEARQASGAIGAPALRTLPEMAGEPVLGASVGDVPDTDSVKALAGALKTATPSLPWDKVLVRRSSRGAPMRIVSLFFPAANIGEAFAVCQKLAEIPPVCAPAVATSDELSFLNGQAVSEQSLRRLGIAPHKAPAETVRTRVVTIEVPQQQQTIETPKQPALAALIQPPLKLQPGADVETPGPRDQVMWLSSKYPMNSAGLVRVVAAGDTMMGSRDTALNPEIKPGVDAASLLGAPLASVFRKADIAFVNLEGPLYDGNEPSPKACGACFSFRSPTRYADVLANMGVDVVSLANNHSGDFGEAGRDSTMAALKARGIAYAGLNRDGARVANLSLANGSSVALVAFAPNSGTLNLNDIPGAVALVRQMKKNHNLVIVSFHGGAEGWSNVHVPGKHEIYVGEDRGDVKAFAHAVIDAGADLVIGHGPHVPRALEIYRGRLIDYSLGNFWTYNGVVSYAVSGLGPVLEAWLAPDGTIAGVALHSTRQAGLGVPHLDPLDEAARYVLYLTKSDFPGTADVLNNSRRIASDAKAGI